MKSGLIIFFLIFICSCNAAKKVDELSSSNATAQQNAPRLWKSSFPKSVKISSGFNTNEKTVINMMLDTYQTDMENKIDFFDNGGDTPEVSSPTLNPTSLSNDGILGIYKFSNWPNQYSGSALAITSTYGLRFNIGQPNEYVEILHADIFINTNFYNFDVLTAGPGYDLRSVVIHELGHFLGLDHKSTESNRALSIMYPSLRSDEIKRNLLSQDKSDLASKYNITLGSSPALTAQNYRLKYTPNPGQVGIPVTIITELMSDGTCHHSMNGIFTHKH